MSRRTTARKIVEELKSRQAPEPPAELRGRLLREMPALLELAPEVSGEAPAAPRRPARWVLAAASVVLAVAAGVVGVRVRDEVPAPAASPVRYDALASEEAAPAADDRVEDGRNAGRARQEQQAAAAAPESPAPAGAVGENITVTAEIPLLDERRVARGTTIPRDKLEKVPTARDPWAVVTQTPEVLSDRVNVGGNESGQQAVLSVPKPVAGSESSSEVGGVVITDTATEGSSPTYYELDQFEEMEVGEGPPAQAKRIPQPEGPLYVAPSAPVPPSTGGTAEPNDQPYGDVFFRAYGTNPFVDTEDDPLSTFALDVDTGSYGVVRRYLSDGHLPPPEAVRVEEMINAFDYGDPAPAPSKDGADFALYAQGSRTPFMAGERYRLIRFALAARQVSAAERKSAVLTFVVDVSGSMEREDRLGLVRKALGLLLDQLRPDDRVALVVYGSRGSVVLPHTGDHAALRRAIESLYPDGSTNAEEGLTLGYDLARRSFREGSINRVILCSDGVANVGATGPDSILARIGAEARGGIELTTVGFGMGNYNDVLMEQLADRGDGAYAYVDTLDEARRVFVENLTGTLQTVARDAKVQVEFDPAVVARYRLLGYENRDVPDERFRDDTVDAGEVGAGHAVTALYEVKLQPRAPKRATAATLRLRYESAETGKVVETAETIAAGELERSWDEAPRALRLASVVAELGEVLKHSYWAKEGDLDGLFRRAQKVSAEYPGDVRVAELATLVGKAAALREP
jgi:Ca-activated chloride channel family protein